MLCKLRPIPLFKFPSSASIPRSLKFFQLCFCVGILEPVIENSQKFVQKAKKNDLHFCLFGENSNREDLFYGAPQKIVVAWNFTEQTKMYFFFILNKFDDFFIIS